MAAKLQPGHHLEFKRTTGRHAGKWVARFYYLSPTDGDLKKKETLHATLTEARQVNRQRSAELLTKGRVPVSKTSTVSVYVQGWLDSNRASWARSTSIRRKAALAFVTKDAIGRMEIGRVRLTHLNDFQERLKAANVPAPTRKNIRDTLNVAFQDALDNDVIQGENPVRRSKAPERTERKLKFFDTAQVQALLAAVEGHHLEPLVITAVYTGLRLSELSGLTWDRVDFERQTILIDQQLQRGKENESEGAREVFALRPVKTQRSKGTFEVSPVVFEKLMPLKARRSSNPSPTDESGFDLVFLTARGEPWHRKSLYDLLNRIYKAAGLPMHGVHVLRHTCASILINNNASVLQVQAQMRHENVRTTLEVYGHLFPEKVKENAEILTRVLRPSEEAKPQGDSAH